MNKIAALCLGLSLVTACASNPSTARVFDPAAHGPAAAEWAPHQKGVEWWYLTGVCADAAGKTYFLQFTIFHGFRFGFIEGFVLHLALTDVANGKHYFFEDAAPPDKRIRGDGTAIVFKDSALSIRTDGRDVTALTVSAASSEISFALECLPAKPAAWHGENGIIVMGHPENDSEKSFYYSFTNMAAAGRLILAGKNIPVKGAGWFDRQWGAFTETAWDWFSLRLRDGRELMLFGFPKTGFVSGTLVKPDGTIAAITKFEYAKSDTLRFQAPGKTYVLGWRVTLPGGESFTIEPVLAGQFNPSANTPPYWEGLCAVSAADGSPLGWCVTETTAGAQ